ncbi:MAG: transporter substrate-binding domain-containing protein [Mesorhizobium sp.]|uniref:transporter substrate-binding domain-containing protein n=1 Tax=Mesorhizobium sp. TaxID=1871066 RepID=UPI0012049BFB|nr:transporter substrate-binding domain-containing protein [Mesorhizobium sp.]TIM28848.1 MAG: transporter substrate-binding domain-containing protein [Mesorhizobium sp.]TIO21286.1 MAG: transporter substrate-binding domain-containing protein [Mesorhizobium sp.]
MTATGKLEVKHFALAFVLTAITLGATGLAVADDLLTRARAGAPFRIGFSNERPWAFPDESGKAAGLMNVVAINTLKAMGITNIEPVIVEWNALIPGLQAGRYDMITGGMYVLKTRCDSIVFSDPVIRMGDVFGVPKGNPKKIETFEDLKNQNSVLVTTAGNNTVEVAKKVGISDDRIMQVPGPTEMLAAVLSNRADAAGTNFFSIKALVDQSDGKLEITDLNKMPEWTLNWAAMGFREEDKSFIEEYDRFQKKYVGSAEMMSLVADYGYTKDNLPGNVSTDWLCKNR